MSVSALANDDSPQTVGGPSPTVAGGREPAVEVVGGADEREVREGLREVAEVLAAWTELLGVQAEVVRVAEHLLEDESRSIARRVDTQRGSVGEMKRTSGMSNADASSVLAPGCWMKARRDASQKRS